MRNRRKIVQYGNWKRTADIVVDGEKNLKDKSYKAWFLTGLQLQLLTAQLTIFFKCPFCSRLVGFICLGFFLKNSSQQPLCTDLFINHTLKILRYIFAYALSSFQTCLFKTAFSKFENCVKYFSITVVSIFTVLFYRVKMNVGVAHSEVNPNTRVMNSRGMWLTYALGVGMLHIVLLSIPFFSVPVAWTLTNVIHNLVSTPSCNKI